MTAPAKLSGKQLRYLRSLAHSLKPIVQIGKNGLTDASISQVDQALSDHELIKIRVLQECPEEADEIAVRAGDRLDAHVAQTLGSVIVLYRKHPQDPRIQLPRSTQRP